MTAFSKISKLVIISMGRAGYTNSSVGGGGGYRIVLRGKGAVWLLDRFYIKYPACFLHRLSYCFNSKENKKTSVVLCLERWLSRAKMFLCSVHKNVILQYWLQASWQSVLSKTVTSTCIQIHCDKLNSFKFCPFFSLQASTLPINSQPDQVTCS